MDPGPRAIPTIQLSNRQAFFPSRNPRPLARRRDMKLSGNTIFITGGGSGIGRGLAEALHKAGNQVIISGRRKGHLDAATSANPGMVSIEMNVNDPASIATVAKRLTRDFPKLNV